MRLIVRREGRRLRRYVHLGTGNYHPGTARTYTDIGLLTARPEIGTDVHKLFQELTGLGHVARLKCLLRSPFTLRSALLERIGREMDEARSGRKARIIARLNSLSEPGVIQALYEASQAGVSVDLLVRGICCLKPGIRGVSDNIRVRSIVGRFLEHSRVYFFFAGGEEELLCSSADWMERNFFRRFEVAFPILDEDLRSRVLAEALELPLSDNQQAWELEADGSYVRTEPGRKQPLRSQKALLDHHGEHFRARPEKGAASKKAGPKRRLAADPELDDREEKRSRRA